LPPRAADRPALRAAIVLLAPALLAGALVWRATSEYGPGLSPDSMQFLAAAKNLAAGHGFRRVEGTPFVEWAPLVPLLLTVVPARALGIASAAGIAWAAGFWVFRRTRSMRVATMAAAAIAVSFPVIFVASHLWSDAPFLFLALVGVLMLERAREGRSVALAAIPAALAALTRYLGVTLIAAGIVTLLLERRPDRLRRAVLYGWLASLPLVLWLVRNVLATGTATGDREPPGFSFATNVRQLAHAVTADLVPWSWPGTIKLALCAAALVGGWLLSRKGAKSVGPLMLFALFYALAVVIVASVWGSDGIDVRLALPLFVALIARAFIAGSRARATWLAYALGALALVWMGRSYIETRRHVDDYARGGVPGFNDVLWSSSPTLARLRSEPPNGVVYSNAPEIAYVALGRDVRRSPRAHLFYAKDAAVPDLEEFHRALAREGPATLAWLDDAGEDRFVTPPELARSVAVEQVARFDDGSLYFVSAR